MIPTGQTIVVTGGTSGIGAALARVLARRNQVISVGRDAMHLKDAERDDGIQGYRCDLSVREEVVGLVEIMRERWGGVDGIINCAGVMLEDSSEEDSWGVLTKTFEINVFAPIQITSLWLAGLDDPAGKWVVNVTSDLAFAPKLPYSLYCASKAALHMYTVALRTRWETRGVQVLELIPPSVQTPLRPGHLEDPQAMPLDAYLRELIANWEGLGASDHELLVERSKWLRFAEREDRMRQAVQTLNPDINHQV